MATEDDLRRICLALPDVTGENLSYGVKNKEKVRGMVWPYLIRVDPKKGRVPTTDRIAIRVASLEEKEVLLASDTETFFTEPHYNGFPAVCVWLERIAVNELEELLTDAWRCLAPKKLVKEFDVALSHATLKGP